MDDVQRAGHGGLAVVHGAPGEDAGQGPEPELDGRAARRGQGHEGRPRG